VSPDERVVVIAGGHQIHQVLNGQKPLASLPDFRAEQRRAGGRRGHGGHRRVADRPSPTSGGDKLGGQAHRKLFGR